MRRSADGAFHDTPLGRLSGWLLLSMVALLPLVHWPFAKDENLAKLLFLAVGLAVAMTLTALRLARHETPAIRWNALDVAVAAYMALSAASWLYSDYRWATLAAIKPLLLYTMLYFVARLMLREAWIQRFAVALVVGFLAVSLVGIIEQFGAIPWGRPNTIGATWFNRTYLAGHLLLVLPIGVWAAAQKRWPVRLLGVGALAAGIPALVLTGARIAWVAVLPMAAVAALAAWPALSTSRRKKLVLVAGVGVVLAAAAQVGAMRVAPHRAPVAVFARAFGNDSSGANVERKCLITAGLRIARDYPVIGTGVGTFVMYAPPRLPREAYSCVSHGSTVSALMVPTHAHNGFVEVAANLGLVGLTVFTSIPLLAWWLARRVLHRKDPPSQARWLVVALLTGVGGFLCANLVGVSLYVPGEPALFYICLALMAAIASPVAAKGRRPDEGARRLPWAQTTAAIVAAVVVAAIGWTSLSGCRASTELAAGEGLLNSLGSYGAGDAVTHFRRACALTPDSPEAHYDLGNALAVSRRFRGALREYETVEKLSPHYGRVHFNKAVCYAQMGDFASAEPEAALAYWQDRLPDSRATLAWLRRTNTTRKSR